MLANLFLSLHQISIKNFFPFETFKSFQEHAQTILTNIISYSLQPILLQPSDKYAHLLSYSSLYDNASPQHPQLCNSHLMLMLFLFWPTSSFIWNCRLHCCLQNFHLTFRKFCDQKIRSHFVWHALIQLLTCWRISSSFCTMTFNKMHLFFRTSCPNILITFYSRFLVIANSHIMSFVWHLLNLITVDFDVLLHNSI